MLLPLVVAAGAHGADWPVYGGSAENIRFSALRQIHRGNVRSLETAWTFDTGDAFPGSELQCNPVVVDGVLYATTPKLWVIALEAATGKPVWAFDPSDAASTPRKNRNRGVTYWASGEDRRIFFVFRNYLYALDARTGRPVRAFGDAGRVDLRAGLGRPLDDVSITATSPGGSFSASWLNLFVSMLHTGVSSEGTEAMRHTLPLRFSRVTKPMLESIHSKFGASWPTFNSGPTRVIGLPFIVTASLRSM